MKFKLLVLLLATCYLLLAIYSFSQVDLNLTLSSNSTYQAFQALLTNLGYYHRPVSTAIYIALVFLLLVAYALLLRAWHKKTLTVKQIWFLIILAVIMLLPAYPAFSHDIFNYLFDARIVTKYNLSPWQYKALDFPQDDWIRFMRWTHRPSVYPPIWIGISLIPSFLGFGKFLPTLYLFKLLIAAAYLGCCRLIYKLKPQALALFAFNPLVIIEALVNAHMEIVMIFYGLLALYAHRRILRWLSYIASVGIKFMTAYLLPAVINPKYLRQVVWLGLALLIGWVIYYGFQPWYLLWVFPFALLIKGKSLAKTLLTLSSISSLGWNIPFILRGDFDLPDPTARLIYVAVPLLILLAISRFKQLRFA